MQSPPSKDLTIVLKKLTEQEISVAAANIFASAFYIGLCARAFETKYYVCTLVMWVENLNFFVILFSNLKAIHRSKAKKADSSTKTKSSDKQPNNNDEKMGTPVVEGKKAVSSSDNKVAPADVGMVMDQQERSGPSRKVLQDEPLIAAYIRDSS